MCMYEEDFGHFCIAHCVVSWRGYRFKIWVNSMLTFNQNPNWNASKIHQIVYKLHMRTLRKYDTKNFQRITTFDHTSLTSQPSYNCFDYFRFVWNLHLFLSASHLWRNFSRLWVLWGKAVVWLRKLVHLVVTLVVPVRVGKIVISFNRSQSEVIKSSKVNIF